MDKSTYLRLLRADSEAFFAAAHLGLEPRIAACPNWNVEGLVGHMGLVYTAWNKRVRERHRDAVEIERSDFDGLPGFFAWSKSDFAANEAPPGVLHWAEHRAEELQTALAEAEPGERVGTWHSPQQTAGFVQRRMALETAVHRWDAQQAHNTSQPIEAELARDGIDEVLDIMVPRVRKWKEAPEGNGERFHFHRTDGDGEWLVTFGADGINVQREHAKGDIALRGGASDLLLWLWGRIPVDRLEVVGDTSYVDRWFELAPTG